MATPEQNAETFEVYTADDAYADIDDWTLQPALIPVSLEGRVLPGIDVAKFVYYSGDFSARHFDGIPVGVYAKLDLQRQWVRVRITDGTATLVDDWIGIIDRQEDSDFVGGEICAVEQAFYAYNPAIELTKIRISESLVAKTFDLDQPDIGEAYLAPFGFGFNIDPYGHRLRPGNKNRGDSATMPADPALCFSRAPNAGIVDSEPRECADRWTASEALDYTLKNDCPEEIQWLLDGQTEALDGRATPQVLRDRRTVFDVINDLIGRRNGVVGFFQMQQPSAGAADPTLLECALVIRSTASSPFTIRTYTFPANDDQGSILTKSFVDISTLSIADSGFDRFDAVIAEGAKITTTASVGWSDVVDGSFHNAWKATVETDYFDGPSVLSGTRDEKNKAADLYRRQLEFEQVFRDFILSDRFITPVLDNPSGDEFYLSPDASLVSTFVDPTGIPALYEYTTAPSLPEYRFAEFYRPIMDEIPHPGKAGDWFRPFVVFPVVPEYDMGGDLDIDASGWEVGSEVSNGRGEDNPRLWNVQLSPARPRGEWIQECHQGPGFSLTVIGGSKNLIARDDLDEVIYIESQNDPAIDTNRALDFKESIVTFTIESDLRVSFQYPASPTAVGNLPLRIRRISHPQSRLDIALPGTILEVDEDGSLITTGTDGETLRDDRNDLDIIAQTFWEWNGGDKKTVEMAFGQVNPNGFRLGRLISSVQTGCSTETCDSVVTFLKYDFLNYRTEVQTQFEEIDVQRALGTVVK